MHSTGRCWHIFNPSFVDNTFAVFLFRIYLPFPIFWYCGDSQWTWLWWTGKKGETGGVSVMIKMHSAVFSRMTWIAPPACSYQTNGACSVLFCFWLELAYPHTLNQIKTLTVCNYASLIYFNITYSTCGIDIEPAFQKHDFEDIMFNEWIYELFDSDIICK